MFACAPISPESAPAASIPVCSATVPLVFPFNVPENAARISIGTAGPATAFSSAVLICSTGKPKCLPGLMEYRKRLYARSDAGAASHAGR